MDDVTASIIINCLTNGANAAISKLGFNISMLTKKAVEFGLQFAQSCLSSFNQAQDVAWRFGKIFRNSMESATNAAKEFSSEYNLSTQSAQAMLSQTAGLLKGFGWNEKDALEMSKSISRWGIDLASFYGTAGGAAQAVADIVQAMTGNTRAMQKYGTLIHTNSEEFKTLQKQIQKNKGVTEDQARAMAVLETITKRNADAQGDYMAEGENWTQAQNNLKEAYTELKNVIGETLYETMGLFSSTERVTEEVSALTEEAKRFRESGAFETWSQFFAGLQIELQVILNILNNIVQLVIQQLTESLAILFHPIEGIKMRIGQIGEVLDLTLGNAWRALSAVFVIGKNIISEVCQPIWFVLKGIGKTVISAILAPVKEVVGWIQAGFYFITGKTDEAKEVLKQTQSDIGKDFASAWEGSSAEEKMAETREHIKENAEAIQGVVDGAVESVANWGKAEEIFNNQHGFNPKLKWMWEGVDKISEAYEGRMAKQRNGKGSPKDNEAAQAAEAKRIEEARRLTQETQFQESLKKLKVQELQINGMEREAKLAEVTLQYEKEKNEIGEKGVKDMINYQMKLYDLQNKNQLKDEMKSLNIQELRLRGFEKEAKEMELMIQYEKDRNKLGENAAQMKLDRSWELWDLEVKKQRMESLSDMYGQKNRFQATSQASVLANSMEGLRLQSRMIIPNGTAADPQKDIANNTRSQKETLNALLQKFNTLLKKIDDLKSSGNSDLSFATV